MNSSIPLKSRKRLKRFLITLTCSLTTVLSSFLFILPVSADTTLPSVTISYDNTWPEGLTSGYSSFSRPTTNAIHCQLINLSSTNPFTGRTFISTCASNSSLNGSLTATQTFYSSGEGLSPNGVRILFPGTSFSLSTSYVLDCYFPIVYRTSTFTNIPRSEYDVVIPYTNSIDVSSVTSGYLASNSQYVNCTASVVKTSYVDHLTGTDFVTGYRVYTYWIHLEQLEPFTSTLNWDEFYIFLSLHFQRGTTLSNSSVIACPGFYYHEFVYSQGIPTFVPDYHTEFVTLEDAFGFASSVTTGVFSNYSSETHSTAVKAEQTMDKFSIFIGTALDTIPSDLHWILWLSGIIGFFVIASGFIGIWRK